MPHLNARVFVLLCLVALASCPLFAFGEPVSVDKESAARALLGEALMMMRWHEQHTWSIPGVTDRVREGQALARILRDYPGTQAARDARHWYGLVLIWSGRNEEAIALAKAAIKDYPGTSEESWAKVVLCIASAKTAKTNKHPYRDIKQVMAISAIGHDMGPLDAARDFVGRRLVNALGAEDAQRGGDPLGLDKSDARGKAEKLATVAAAKGIGGDVFRAMPYLDRLARECPDEKDELNWARYRVGTAYLSSHGCKDQSSPMVAQWLQDIPIRSGDDLSAAASLWLARYSADRGQLAEASNTLEKAKEPGLDTAHGAEILYSLGTLYEMEGKHAEATAAMKQLVQSKPESLFYASMAEFFIDQQEALGKCAAFVSAMRDAESHYAPSRRFLAYCPTDTSLSPSWMTAAQVVSLIGEGLNEEALRVASNLRASPDQAPADALRAKGEVLLCSMRMATDLGRLLRAQPDTLLPLYGPKDETQGQLQEARLTILDEALAILTACDDAKCSPSSRHHWLRCLANGYAGCQRPSKAVKVIKLALAIPGSTRDEQAALKYRAGMLYRDMNYKRSAYQVMDELANHYADTSWGEQATRTSNGWRIVEQLQAEKAQSGGN